jgi:hypothetical protein
VAGWLTVLFLHAIDLQLGELKPRLKNKNEQIIYEDHKTSLHGPGWNIPATKKNSGTHHLINTNSQKQ